MPRRQVFPSRKLPQRKSRHAARQFHPRAVEPLEERRLLSATSDAPVAEPLVLMGLGEYQVHTVDWQPVGSQHYESDGWRVCHRLV